MQKGRWMVGLLAFLLALGSVGRTLAVEASAPEDNGQAAVSQAETAAMNKAVAEKLAASQGPAPVKVGANFQFCYTHASNGVAGTGGLYTFSQKQWGAFSFKRVELFLNSTVAGDPQLLWAMSFDFAQSSFNGLTGTTGSNLVYE